VLRRIVRFEILLVFTVIVLGSCISKLDRAVYSPVIKDGRVIFRYFNPTARTVQLAGDWPGNNWAEGDEGSGEVLVGLMKYDRGYWTLELELAPGVYRYRFLVNEREWVLDPSNPRVVEDGMGQKANLLIIP